MSRDNLRRMTRLQKEIVSKFRDKGFSISHLACHHALGTIGTALRESMRMQQSTLNHIANDPIGSDASPLARSFMCQAKLAHDLNKFYIRFSDRPLASKKENQR